MIARAYLDEYVTEVVSVVAAPASSSSLYICNTRQIHEHTTCFSPIAPSYTDEIEVREKSRRAQRDSSNSSGGFTLRTFGSCPVIPGCAGDAFSYLGQLVTGVPDVAMAGLVPSLGSTPVADLDQWIRVGQQ